MEEQLHPLIRAAVRRSAPLLAYERIGDLLEEIWAEYDSASDKLDALERSLKRARREMGDLRRRMDDDQSNPGYLQQMLTENVSEQGRISRLMDSVNLNLGMNNERADEGLTKIADMLVKVFNGSVDGAERFIDGIIGPDGRDLSFTHKIVRATIDHAKRYDEMASRRSSDDAYTLHRVQERILIRIKKHRDEEVRLQKELDRLGEALERLRADALDIQGKVVELEEADLTAEMGKASAKVKAIHKDIEEIERCTVKKLNSMVDVIRKTLMPQAKNLQFEMWVREVSGEKTTLPSIF